VTTDAARLRHRQGAVRIVDGIPYADSSSTLSLLPGAAVGQFLAGQTGLLRGRLLDNGCGNQPFRPWYEPHVDEVITLDAAPGEGVAILGFADRLPFADRTFDTVLATEVLEHVENVERAAAELFRVLRPGGHALVTVPYLYPTHEAPYDFRRFTHFGLADLLKRNGFEVLTLQAKGGPAIMMAHYAVLAITQALGARIDKPGLRRLLSAPQEAFAHRRQVQRDATGRSAIISLGYMAAARRPLDS
jgi:SAM-dependent methyltransferase